MPLDEIVRFYEATFDDPKLQTTLLTAPDFSTFKTMILDEAVKGGFIFTPEELDASFDGMGESDIYANVVFGSPWIARIMRFGWVPKGYSR